MLNAITVPNTVPMVPNVKASKVGPASFIILRRLALNSKSGMAIGTRYDHTISYDGASVGMIERFDNKNVPKIVTITAESLDPIFVLSAQSPKAAAIKSIAHKAQCWSEEISGYSNNVFPRKFIFYTFDFIFH
jgi:hypothetical protein